MSRLDGLSLFFSLSGVVKFFNNNGYIKSVFHVPFRGYESSLDSPFLFPFEIVSVLSFPHLPPENTPISALDEK